ncbi:uncharacterized protein si:ch73-44m9.1 [Danio aesculapii]|uniref:uncharacterized protein si:ch73-44m9.1 n=1 Tax=Danio aesculapii TaxID=1142201 RepID=UPI0024C067B9|nr:uncharacterized protein si:ch73-44m9.1 [Danio aesculapii]
MTPCINGVVSADEDEVKSVMEGEPVTLNPDLTQIKEINQKKWSFQKKGSDTPQVIEDVEIWKGRWKMDHQTGNLTINNTRTKHTGLYILKIELNTGPKYKRFTVTVNEVPSVIEGHEAETKSLSVIEGNLVTLHTDITKLNGDELIVWRFGDEGKLLTKEDKETKSPPYYSTDERFRDRLQLNDQTGSLTIKNMKDTDAGLYTLKINSNKQILHRKFIVTVSGE